MQSSLTSGMAEQLTSSSSATPKDVPARILKKRESDRRCQRIKRERTKSKIAALEEKVRNFGDQDATGQVQMLMRQLQDVERERDQLAKKVKTIESVIREGETEVPDRSKDDTGHAYSASGHPSPSIAESLEYDHNDTGARFRQAESGASASQAGMLDEADNSTITGPVAVPYDVPLANNAASLIDGIHDPAITELPPPPDARAYQPHPPARQPCECCTAQGSPDKPAPFNTWRFANEALSSRFKWPAYFRLLQDNCKEDTPVRAIVEGWHSIEARGPMHPTWQIMKKLDQVVLARCKPKERLAVLFAIHLLLLSHTSPEVSSELPEYYQKRPSQNMADSYAIHFFPWPGMRERFVFNQHRYCTNDFWNTFINSLVLVWPFEFRDCYTRNIETEMYSISPLFQERIKDINFWTMNADLFMKWPELRADIPSYNSIPGSVSNMIQRSRSSKATFLPAKRVARKGGTKSAAVPAGVPQAAQPYVQSQDVVLAPFYARATPYNIDDKTIPNGTWTANLSQQLLEDFSYFGATNNTMNTMNGF